MEIHRFYEPRSFLARVKPLLDRHPGKYNLIRRVLHVLIETDQYKQFYLFSVTDNGRVVGAALWTPPHPVQVTELPPAAVGPLVRAIAKCEDQALSLGGPRPSVDSLAEDFAKNQKFQVSSFLAQGVYQLEEVSALEPGEGCLRYATHLDLDLLTAWNVEFQREAWGPTNPDLARRAAERALANRSAFFWTIDRERVAMAGAHVCPPYGRTIGPVYTPEVHRGKGYATSLVWTLSRALLQAGNRYCFLHTDLANATANSIYRKIGYEQIGEAAHVTFKPENRAAKIA